MRKEPSTELWERIKKKYTDKVNRLEQRESYLRYRVEALEALFNNQDDPCACNSALGGGTSFKPSLIDDDPCDCETPQKSREKPKSACSCDTCPYTPPKFSGRPQDSGCCVCTRPSEASTATGECCCVPKPGSPSKPDSPPKPEPKCRCAEEKLAELLDNIEKTAPAVLAQDVKVPQSKIPIKKDSKCKPPPTAAASGGKCGSLNELENALKERIMPIIDEMLQDFCNCCEDVQEIFEPIPSKHNCSCLDSILPSKINAKKPPPPPPPDLHDPSCDCPQCACKPCPDQNVKEPCDCKTCVCEPCERGGPKSKPSACDCPSSEKPKHGSDCDCPKCVCDPCEPNPEKVKPAPSSGSSCGCPPPSEHDEDCDCEKCLCESCGPGTKSSKSKPSAIPRPTSKAPSKTKTKLGCACGPQGLSDSKRDLIDNCYCETCMCETCTPGADKDRCECKSCVCETCELKSSSMMGRKSSRDCGCDPCDFESPSSKSSEKPRPSKTKKPTRKAPSVTKRPAECACRRPCPCKVCMYEFPPTNKRPTLADESSCDCGPPPPPPPPPRVTRTTDESSCDCAPPPVMRPPITTTTTDESGCDCGPAEPLPSFPRCRPKKKPKSKTSNVSLNSVDIGHMQEIISAFSMQKEVEKRISELEAKNDYYKKLIDGTCGCD